MTMKVDPGISETDADNSKGNGRERGEKMLGVYVSVFQASMSTTVVA